MKVAIVHDDLMRRGGGEQVVRCIHLAFPQADFYTSVYDPTATYPYFREIAVKTTWYRRIAKNENAMKTFFFPLGLVSMITLNLKKYDLVIISGTYSAKYVRLSRQALKVYYCYTPFRLAWRPFSYPSYVESRGPKKLAYRMAVNMLRSIDASYGRRLDHFIAMTEETKQRLETAYKPVSDVAIIPPPVNTSHFKVAKKTEDYYLIVSRFEYYKRVDLAIEAFNELGKKLIVVGMGSLEGRLKSLAGPTIEFRSGLSFSELAVLYSKCRAFIFPQHEDYGITPLEANASGRPVIAYEAGGVLETMIPYKDEHNSFTAIFFKEQTTESLKKAILEFEGIENKVDSHFIQQHAFKFDEKIFIEKIRDHITGLYSDFQIKRQDKSLE